MKTGRLPFISARREFVLAVVSGVGLALSFPVPDLEMLAWFAFVPLLFALEGKSPRSAFNIAFITGIVANAAILYWLNIVMVTFGKLHWSLSVLLYLLFSAYLALFFGIVLLLVKKGEGAGISPLLSFPVAWVGLEYFRSFFLTGFPWASLGYSQYRFLHLIQIADLAGVYGVSFILALANVILYRIICWIIRREGGFPVKSLALLVLLLGSALLYGRFRMAGDDPGPPQKVALIQGNIPQDVKWNPAYQEETVAIYERLTRKAAAAENDLVVWPESATPFFFQDDPRYAERIKALAREVRSDLIFGSPAFRLDGERVTYLNSAFLLSRNGEVMGQSSKMHLVPFGEYVPLARFLPFVNKLVQGIGDFSPGQAIAPLDTAKGKVGVLICFEGIFPELSREYVRRGARLLVNISNDAWYKRSSAPYQHLSMTTFRAVENRVPFLRATNTGISAIIDSHGGLHQTTPLFEEAVVTGTVRAGTGLSFYNRYGDMFAGLCLASALVIAGVGWRRKIT